MMLNHLGALQRSFKGLGNLELISEVQKLVDNVHAEVGSRTIEELEAERDDLLLASSHYAQRGA